MFDLKTLEAMVSLRRDDITHIPMVSESEIDEKDNLVSLDINVVDLGQGLEDRYDKLFKSVMALHDFELDSLFCSMGLDRFLHFIPKPFDLYTIETQRRKAAVKAICNRLSEKLNALFP